MAGNRIQAIMIVEVAGRPADYIKESLKLHLEHLKNIKDTEVLSISVNDSKQLESEQEMYTCFAEVEFKTINLSRLIEIIFDFMPSSIEILEPAELSLSVAETNAFLNDLSGRLHKYDEIAKIAQIRTQQLLARFQEMQKQMQSGIKPEKNQKPKIEEKKKKNTRKAKSKKKSKTKK